MDAAKIPEDPMPLTREECIVKTVLGIIGGATVIEDGIERQIGRHDIHEVLYHLREACLTAKRLRARQSKQAMRAIKQLSTALRRANQPKGGLPEDIRLLLGLDRMIYHLAAYGRAHRKPKPDAIRKRLAADYALDLCERFGVKTTTARTGKFCLVAAALFGDPDVDLQYPRTVEDGSDFFVFSIHITLWHKTAATAATFQRGNRLANGFLDGARNYLMPGYRLLVR